MEYIGDEEDAGDRESPDHAVAVGNFALGFDEDETGREEKRGNGVEAGVETWQVRNAHGTLLLRSSLRQVSAM